MQLTHVSGRLLSRRVLGNRPAARSGRRLLAVGLGTLACALGVISSPTLIAQQPPPPLGSLAPGPPPAATDRAAALQAEAERLARQSRTLLGELRRLEVDRQLQDERARRASAALASASKELARATARLTELDAQRNAQLPDIRASLVDLYKRGRSGNLRLLLGATSVREFARATRAVASMSEITQARLDEHRLLLAEAGAERAARAEAVGRLQEEGRNVARARAAAAAAIETRTALLADVDRRRDLTAQLAGELQVATDALNERVEAIAAAPPPASALAPVFPPRSPVRGGLAWPLDGRVSGRFGETPVRTPGAPPRNGIDIEAPEGAPARAIHAGTVVFAEPLAGFGILVIVDHSGGHHSVYGNLASTTLSRGDVVDVGREVGKVGRTAGGPTALYFEFRVDGRPVDPLQWLRRR